MKVTIRKIAEIAEVSKTTVDKVLNDKPGVSDKVRARVKKIIDDLDYTPNAVARALNYQKNPTIFAVIIPKEDNPFYHSVKEGMKSASKEMETYGMKVEYYHVSGFKVEEEIAIVNYLKGKKISGLAIRSLNDEKLRKALNSLIKSGIPVVTFDTDIPNIDRLAFVGEDQNKSGKIAAELMSKLIGDKGKAAVIIGSMGIEGHRLRYEGFRNFLKETTNIEVAKEIETLEQDIITFEKTKELLAKNPDLNGIYVAASSAKQVCKAVYQDKETSKIKIITYNFTDEIRELIEEGKVDFTIGISPYQQGEKVIKTLADYTFKKEDPQSKEIRVPITIGIKSNIDDWG